MPVKIKRKIKAIDFFCGGGGTSSGAEATGEVDVVYALNHWDVAIQTHSINFRHCHHFCDKLANVPPSAISRKEKLRIFYASPECTGHSNAAGGRPKNDQSRCQANDILKWAWHHRPSFMVIENVREFIDWGPLNDKDKPIPKYKGKMFDAWIMSLRAIGYNVEWRLLNAADFGAPTSRVRLFVICRLGNKRIPWPEPTHTERPGNELPGMGLPRWRSASEIIDWSIPFPSVFGRKRMLKPKTITRIETGLSKFVAPFVFQMQGPGLSDPKYSGTRDIDRPTPTLLTRNNHGVMVPYVCTFRENAGSRSVLEPIGTITAGGRHHGVAMPFVMQYHGGSDGHNRTYSMADPLKTIDTQPRYALTVPYLVDTAHGDKNGKPSDRSYSVDNPLGAVTTQYSMGLSAPFLMKYYGTNTGNSVDEPLGTVTCEDRHAIILPCAGVPMPAYPDDPAYHSLVATMQRLGVVDIGFRMFTNRELALAQGFDPAFQFAGKATEITTQIGNSVSPIQARAITEAILSA